MGDLLHWITLRELATALQQLWGSHLELSAQLLRELAHQLDCTAAILRSSKAVCSSQDLIEVVKKDNIARDRLHKASRSRNLLIKVLSIQDCDLGSHDCGNSTSTAKIRTCKAR